MCARKFPPSRSSQATIVPLKPFGPIHRARCSGSVQHLKTSSRGASKTRSIMSSRSVCSVTTALLLAAILFLPHSCSAFVLRLKLAQIIVEPVETVLPETTIFLEPVGGVFERGADEPAGPPLRLAPP